MQDRTSFRVLCQALFLSTCVTLTSVASRAQNDSAAPVFFATIIEDKTQNTIRLPGTLEASSTSFIASDVEGIVAEILAREGDAVTKGQALARLRTAQLELELAQLEASSAESIARVALLERNLNRSRELLSKKSISQQKFDQDDYEFKAAEVGVKRLDAQIARIKLDIENSTIVAPFDGIVVERHTEVGEWRDQGATFFELMSMQELEVHVAVPEQYYRNLKIDQSAAISFEAIPELEMNAAVTAIIPRADPRARTFQIKLGLQSPDARLGVGMVADVELSIMEEEMSLLVPKDAIVRGEGQEMVYVVGEDSTAVATDVITKAGFGDWVVVEGELQGGQKVITRGNEGLQPGQLVQGSEMTYRAP